MLSLAAHGGIQARAECGVFRLVEQRARQLTLEIKSYSTEKLIETSANRVESKLHARIYDSSANQNQNDFKLKQ